MAPRFVIAVTVAFHCLIAQFFLSLAAFIAGAAVLTLVELDPAALVMIPVAAFAAYVGVLALFRARDVMVGPGPLM